MTFVLCVLIILVLSFFHVLLHELGHAVPAFLLTKQKVEVYVGSHGNKDHCIKISTRPIDFWIKYNPFSWLGGMCRVTAKDVSVNTQIIYTAIAPVVSIVYFFLVLWSLPAADPYGKLSILPLLLAMGGFTLLAINLLPVNVPLKTGNGTFTYNDGYTLRLLLKAKKIEKQYIEALKYYNNDDYKKASRLFEEIIKEEFIDTLLFRYALSTFVMQKNYAAADRLMKKAYQLNITEAEAIDYLHTGLVKLHNEEYDEAIEKFKKVLELQADDVYALNNLGYTFTMVNRFTEAIVLLDKVIALKPDGAYGYNNRGYAKVKTGDKEEGLSDIKKSLELDNTNSYAYRNMGIYYMETCDYKEALTWLTKARKMDADTPMLTDLLKLTEDKLLTNALAI